MTKHVVSSDQVAHLWAHRAQEWARNGSQSMSFQGELIFSYATPIGRLVRDALGRDVALFTAHKYSATTSSRHMHAMTGAARHLPNFTVPFFGIHRRGRHGPDSPDMAEAHAGNQHYLAAQYAEHVARMLRALSRPYSYEWLHGLADTAKEYASEFNLPAPVFDTAADIAKIEARHDRLDAKRAAPGYDEKKRAEREKREARAEAKRARERELAAADAATRLAAWRNGERVYIGYSERGAYAALRLTRDGRDVETSHGAKVPAADARRAVVFIADKRRRAVAWARNGETFPVGNFQLDRVTERGDVIAGCHRIEWAEVVRLSAALGVPFDDSGVKVRA